jgi:hypothetical protein
MPFGNGRHFAGGPWTDYPLMVDPMLATLGRVINDRTTTSGGRRGLLILAPWMITGGLLDGVRLAQGLADLAAGRLLGRVDAATDARVVAHLSKAARAGSSGDGGWVRWRRRRRAVALVRLAARAAADEPDPDVSLFALLLAAVNEARRLEGRAPVKAEASDHWPASLPVRVQSRIPDGSE